MNKTFIRFGLKNKASSYHSYLKGVSIWGGALIGANSVATMNIPQY
jgi:hypothetical protein